MSAHVAMEPWRIELFGGLKAQQGERVLTHFETRKIAALLAWLALHPQRPHPREVVAEQLWPEEDWDATRNRLRQALSSLRRELEPPGTPDHSVLVADRSHVWLNPAAVMTDVAEFEAALQAAAQSTDPSGQVLLLRQAVGLYRGELLPGYYEDSVIADRERLAEAYRNALGQLAKALAAAGDLQAAIDVGRRAVAADPLREDAHCDLMRFYAAAGRSSEALRQYRELERILREELGAIPSAATQGMLEDVRAQRSAPAGTSPATRSDVSAPVPPAGRAPQATLEPEGGAVPLDSRFYIVRPTDAEFQAAIARQDSIVLVKGARQIGKTSLLARGLQQAREGVPGAPFGPCPLAGPARVVLTDLQKLAEEQLESPATLFMTFAEMIIDQLELDLSLDAIWNPRRGWNVNFERFLRREVLDGGSAPLVWGLDEVDRLFGYPLSTVVFGLFRSWHN
jgi:DNA-binding SARP family transcriptional activator/transposase-like protein